MKENQFMSILFWLWAQKTDDSGKAPIYCRITLNGNRTLFSTAKRVNPDHWNSAANKVNNKCPDAIAINEDLESIKGDLRKVYNQLCVENPVKLTPRNQTNLTPVLQSKLTPLRHFKLTP